MTSRNLQVHQHVLRQRGSGEACVGARCASMLALYCAVAVGAYLVIWLWLIPADDDLILGCIWCCFVRASARERVPCLDLL